MRRIVDRFGVVHYEVVVVDATLCSLLDVRILRGWGYGEYTEQPPTCIACVVQSCKERSGP